MNWFSKAITSTLGRKLTIALTGLFLCTFLVVHVVGNFQLFKNDEGVSFNLYSVFMTTNPIIKTVSYVLYACILIHIIQSIILAMHNRKSRRVNYLKNNPSKNSSWTSRNMTLLGFIIMLFLGVHMVDFWAEYKFGEVPRVNYVILHLNDGTKRVFYRDSINNPEFVQRLLKSEQGLREKIYKDEQVACKNLYMEVKETFEDKLWVVILYVIGMVALSFHLVHGFQSAWRTIGVTHRKFLPIIQIVGWLFAIIIPAGFAAMPLYFHFFK